jgi:large subunit ribosomal protein L1
MAHTSKRLKKAYEPINRDRSYGIEEAVKIIKDGATAKFDETIEIAINLAVDPKHADQNVRGTVTLPHGTGKALKVAVFAKGDKLKDAQAAGADLAGGEDLAEKIRNGEIGFDRCIATPDMMAVVGKLGKLLGPKGLMPNPKLGTVTTDVVGAIKSAKAGQLEFRVEKAGIVHAGIGKASFSQQQLVDNVSAFVDAIAKAKPSGVKGTYMKRVSLSSTMGPGLKLDIASLRG